MALKTFRPTSPGRRQLVIVDRAELHKGKPVKALTEGLTKSGGRNNAGRVTAFRHRRRPQALVSQDRFQAPQVGRRSEGRAARVRSEPHRFIALIKYADGEQAYIIAPQRLKVGDTVVAGERVDVKPGNAMPLKSIPVGTIVHNIELKPLKGAQMARSAGTYAQVVGRDAGYAQLRMASGEVRMVQDVCMATIGAVSNPDNMNEVWGKAGRTQVAGPQARPFAASP